MLEGAAQILAYTNCLASGGAWLLPAAPVHTPTVNVSLPALPHCRHPESGLEPSPKELEVADIYTPLKLSRCSQACCSHVSSSEGI